MAATSVIRTPLAPARALAARVTGAAMSEVGFRSAWVEVLVVAEVAQAGDVQLARARAMRHRAAAFAPHQDHRDDGENQQARGGNEHRRLDAAARLPDPRHQILRDESADIAERIDRRDARRGARAGEELRRHRPEARQQQIHARRAETQRNETQRVGRQKDAAEKEHDAEQRGGKHRGHRAVAACAASTAASEHDRRGEPRHDVQQAVDRVA